MLLLGELVAHFLIVAVQEIAHVEDNVNLVGAAFDGQGCLGDLHLGEALRGGEAAGYADNVNTADVEDGANHGCEVGVYADTGHGKQLGILLLEGVDALGEAGYGGGRVGGFQGCEVNGVEEKLVDVLVAVFVKVLGKNPLDGGSDSCVIGGHFGLRDEVLIFVTHDVVSFMVFMLKWLCTVSYVIR